MTREQIEKLEAFALQIRIGTVECIKSRGFGHIGGCLSVADVLAVLYGDILNIDPNDPKKPDRDKFVSSKGHAGPAIYATLALKGFFPYEKLYTLNQPGTDLPSHCDRKKTPGIDMTTGSLGQGTSAAVGLALGDRLQGRSSRTYLLVGDGESQEGQVWEAAMFASAKKLSNMTWMIDWNKRQLDGYVKDIIDLGDLQKKFEAFGFDACTVDGHDVEQIHKALSHVNDEKPVAVILDTLKGKGVKQVEETVLNHSMSVGPDVFDGWLQELKDKQAAMAAGR